MISIKKTYKDFNGVERTETRWFNLSESEVMEMELGTAGALPRCFRELLMPRISRRLSDSSRISS